MATVIVRCECGERFKSGNSAQAASGITCPRCHRTLKIRRVRERERPAKAAVVSNFHSPDLRARLGQVAAALKGALLSERTGSRQRALFMLSWAYVFAAALLALFLWTFGDHWWPGTAFLFIGRWIALLPLAVLIPAAVFVSPRLLLPLGAATLIILGPVMGARVGFESFLPAPDGPRIRVMSYNVEGAVQPAVDLQVMLHRWEPDIVAFQECGSVMARAIRELSGWHHHRANGLCLVTKFPIQDSVVMDRSTLEMIKESNWGIGGSGDVVRYTLESPFGVINFTNLHLETPRKGFEGFFNGSPGAVDRLKQNTALRDMESRLARRHVDAGGPGAIVAGDFNTPVESRIFRRHWGGLKNAYSRAGFGFGMTKDNGWIRIRIDHVLADGSWRVVNATVGRDTGSSHQPVVVDLARIGK